MLPQIEAFLEVAKRQNLSRAADALFVSQPTVTVRLQTLEAELQERLFVRTRRGMRLTEAGEAFLPYAERAVQALADGRERLGELRRGSAGKLVLGAPATVSAYALPLILARFTAEHPSVRLVLKSGTSEEILELVLQDHVQVGLMLRQAGALPGGIMELDNIEAAKKMVERGLGISLVPRSAVTAELAAGALHLVDLADGAPGHREIVAVRRRDAGPPSGAVAAFMRLLTEVRAQLELGAAGGAGPRG